MDKSLKDRVISGRYKVIGLLGKGSYGHVLKAEHVLLHRPVAIKVLRRELDLNKTVLTRFEREARATCLIGHPNIVEVFDFGHEAGIGHFFVMEYLEGETLKAHMDRKGTVPPEDAIPIILQVCDALGAAHEKGIIHRDLKPENIFILTHVEKGPTVKILDFGTALLRTEGKPQRRITKQGFVMGTPKYMAPEQAMGKEIDGKSDIYALGVIMFEVLTGRLPHHDESLPAFIRKKCKHPPMRLGDARPQAEFHPLLENIVAKALATKPADRYQSASSFGWDLETYRKTVHWSPRDSAIIKTLDLLGVSVEQLKQSIGTDRQGVKDVPEVKPGPGDSKQPKVTPASSATATTPPPEKTAWRLPWPVWVVMGLLALAVVIMAILLSSGS